MDDMGSESTSILRNLKFWKLDFQGSGFDTDRVQSSESYPLMFGVSNERNKFDITLW